MRLLGKAVAENSGKEKNFYLSCSIAVLPNFAHALREKNPRKHKKNDLDENSSSLCI